MPSRDDQHPQYAVRGTSFSSIFQKNQDKTWPNPEQSVGRFIHQIGKNCVWEAKGEALRAYNALAPSIKDFLDVSVEPIPCWVGWSMYMIGRIVQKASPTIIFYCEEEKHRCKVRNIIKDSKLLDGYPGFKTGHMPRPPGFDHLVPLGFELGARTHRYSRLNLRASPVARGACLSIEGTDSKGSPWWSQSTIGGVILIGGRYFYTTTAHAFRHEADSSSDVNDLEFMEQDCFSFDGDSDLEYDSGEVDEEDGMWDTEFMLQGGCSEDQLSSSSHSLPRKNHGIQEDQSSQSDYQEELFDPILETSETGLDWAVIEVTKQAHRRGNTLSRTNERIKVESVGSGGLDDTPILSPTTRGIMTGTLLATPSYLRTSKGWKFQEMYTVQLDTQLQKGDCGSWIVDAETGNLYGHIVAGSPGSGMALIAPFTKIFDALESRWGVRPMLEVSDLSRTRDSSEIISRVLASIQYRRDVIATRLGGHGRTYSYNIENRPWSTDLEAWDSWVGHLVTTFDRNMRYKRLSDLESKRSSTNGFADQDRPNKVKWLGLRPVWDIDNGRQIVPYVLGDVIPRWPSDNNRKQAFLDRLVNQSLAVLKWEDPELQRAALKKWPLVFFSRVTRAQGQANQA